MNNLKQMVKHYEKSIMNKDVTNKQLEKSWKLYGIKYPGGFGCEWQKTQLKLS